MPHCAAVGNHFFDETFACPYKSPPVVKLLLFLFLAGAALIPARASEFVTVEEVAGRLAVAKGGPGPVNVLVFLSHDCPVSNALMPELNRIVRHYRPLGVAFYFVYAEDDLSETDAAKHAREFGLTAAATVDRAGVLVAKAGATVTPEAAVFSRSGEVAYRGRINDLFAAPGQKRAEPTRHDLRVALDALLAGKAPPNTTTPAIGCFIPGKR